MAGAVASALSSDWLNIDSAANAGSGTTPQTEHVSNLPNPSVPVPGHAIAPDTPDFAPASDTVLWENSHWAGAWPTFTQGDWKQGLADTPEGNIHGEPDPLKNHLAADTHGVGVRVDSNTYAGFDAHSQTTDNKGWKISTPSGRSATRRLIGADGVGYEDYWYQTAERPIPKRLARVAAPNNSPNGTPGVLNGQLPAYADVNAGGPWNVAYGTPAPPATSNAPAAQPAGPDWTWGGF